MSFLQPWLLLALPLALVPVVIHLIHLHRRRAVRWAAMMFLRAAQRMSQGLSKLRQYLILALRVLVVAALLLMAGRPLAGGLLGLTGGAPDTVLLLIDRSASMEEQNLATGISKRAAGLESLRGAIAAAYGSRSKLVAIDSARLEVVDIEGAEALSQLPMVQGTSTAADIPALMQVALDVVTTRQTGRTDIWLLSDLRQADWDARGGRWEGVRSGFATLPGVRFHLLTYPEVAEENLRVEVERAVRRKGPGGVEVRVDLRIARSAGAPAEPMELPLRVTMNGVTSGLTVVLKDREVVVQGQSLPLDGAVERGWGAVELPADANLADNRAVFVFDDPPPLRSVVVTEEATVAGPMKAALTARVDPSRRYECEVLPPGRVAEIEWEEMALVVWQAAIPGVGSVERGLLETHAAEGRALLFLPPDSVDGVGFGGLSWEAWQTVAGEELAALDWWRSDADLLGRTRDGKALPVGELGIRRWCAVAGEGVPLARRGAEVLVQRSAEPEARQVWFAGLWPGVESSSLAREGVVLFAMLHRALEAGMAGLGGTRQRVAGKGVFGEALEQWKAVAEGGSEGLELAERGLRVGVFERRNEDGEVVLTAVNRPVSEDGVEVLGEGALEELFAGLDFRVIEDRVEEGRSLASEVWRTFLVLMAVAMLGEALLCLPGRARGVSGAGLGWGKTGEAGGRVS